MTKIDIFSGFLGAGKTTLIKKLIKEAYAGERVVLIENEFGEIGIDGGFLADAGIVVNEMNSGCICCSLVGDFGKALARVLDEYAPDRIVIEPSGVGKLSDVISAVKAVGGAELSGVVTVADAKKCRMHMRNFGEFFNDQIAHARTLVLSHTKGLDEDKLEAAVEALRTHNESAVIVTTDWEELTGAQLLAAISGSDTLKNELQALGEAEQCPVCGHHHHHHEHHHHHHEECCHEHEHHHDHHGECCHDHEHHHDHHEECCHEHEHHHDHQGECCHEHEHHHDHHGECCHEHEHHHDHHGECCHDHEHHHHHHADEVFVSCGAETAKRFSKEALSRALCALDDAEKYGTVLRAKGIVAGEGDTWLHFDYVPGEPDVRSGAADVTGRICVIGADLDKEKIAKLFGV